ncbi:phage tail protein [Azospirillum picis]|uniref:Microcystin-dependent protein n=1 Tax=Azospirillum picis TaxID=488438 RepID=A0ABU0MG61_9PROT|nr:phage tail protein [Azospirillum picis]MDQ0532430.1 microcystin-dependent protein [Azospirillum picis]
MVPYDFVPDGFAACDGSSLNVTSYEALYSVMGNKFGGDDKQSFKLPDLRGKEPVLGLHYVMCLTGLYPDRQ